jgi:hypothetical protein
MFWRRQKWQRPKMELREALQEIQRMHATETVRRESIIAWYRWFHRRVPRDFPVMVPERSEGDLVMTAALWMTLSDVGGDPPFPYDYRSELNLSPEPTALNPELLDDPEIRALQERVLAWSTTR